jgi:hypothetical protein
VTAPVEWIVGVIASVEWIVGAVAARTSRLRFDPDG